MSGQYYKRDGLTSYLHIYSTNATHVASVSVCRNMTPGVSSGKTNIAYVPYWKFQRVAAWVLNRFTHTREGSNMFTDIFRACMRLVHPASQRDAALDMLSDVLNKTGNVCTRVGTLIMATTYLQLIQNRYTFRSFTLLQCSHQHCVQPVVSDVEVVGYF
jgi:hypothetical protein